MKRIIVQGKGGFTGKSTLIKKIVQLVTHNLGPDAVTATKGAASTNINGNTIHTRFKISYTVNNIKDLTDEPLR